MKVNLEELVVKHLNSDTFAIYLAQQVAEIYEDKLLQECHTIYSKAIDVQVKRIVQVYIEHFEQEADIKAMVNRAIQGITKQDLLNKL